MLSYKISICDTLLEISKSGNLIISGHLIRSFFKSEVFFYTPNKQPYAKYTIVDFLFIKIKNQILFIESNEISLIRKKINQANLHYKNNVFTIKYLLLKNKTELLLNGKKIGEMELLEYNNKAYVLSLICESESAGEIFAVFALSLNINDGGL